jgi:hypothetical protein
VTKASADAGCRTILFNSLADPICFSVLTPVYYLLMSSVGLI